MPMKTQIWQQVRVSCKAGLAALTRKTTENLAFALGPQSY